MADGLLLLHAFPLDASMWAPQREAFDDRLPLVAPDMAGFGATGGDPVSSLDSAAAAAADAVREAGLDRVVVCGLSMGGYEAFAFWRLHPSLVAGLVLADTRAAPDSEEGAAGRRKLAARLRAEGNRFLAGEPPPLLAEDAPIGLLELVKGSIARQPAEAIAAAAEAMADRPDSGPDLAGITVPTLVIHGEKDRLIPAAEGRAMAARIPGAAFALINDAGHLANMEAPDAFNALLEQHLVRCGVL